MAALRALLALALALTGAPAAAGPVDRRGPYIAEASSRFGMPAGWIRRVIRLESGGRDLADGQPVLSRAGAMGLMQLMPDTWRDMRALLGLGADPFDAHDNILAGTAYLRLMYDRFGYPGLFAAYNAGPSRYASYLAAGRELPSETRAYVAAAAPEAVRLQSKVRTVLPTGRRASLFVPTGAGRSGEQRADDARAGDGTLFVELTAGAAARQ